MITPTRSGLEQLTRFPLLTSALDYAANGQSGINFYSARGVLTTSITYGELREQAICQAGRLQTFGLAPGDRVGLSAETTPDFIVGFFACVYAGLVPVPLPVPGAFSDRVRHAEQIRRQLTDCGARLLLAPEEHLKAPRGAGAAGAMPELSWADLQQEPARELADPHVQPDDICYLQYSSGSTRFPTGVAVTHRALMCNCHEIAADALNIDPDDRTVSWLPLYHDMGLVGSLLASLACQVSVDLLATEDFARRPLVWLQIISRNRGTIAYGPCFGYDLCRRRAQPAQLAELDLASWRVAGVGAELIDPAVMEQFAETFAPAGFRRESVLASYGLAEATLGVSFGWYDVGLCTDTVARSALSEHRRAAPAERDDGRTFVRCGRPLPSLSVEIRDPSARALPPRRVGGVHVRGTSVMQGYFGDRDGTAAVLDEEGWLNTGDLGYLADGELVIVGRAKETIIINGRNIWPQDLEWIVEQLPEVRSRGCAAFGVLEAQRERAVVLVENRSRAASERARLAAAAHRELLQATGISCRVVLVPPRTLPRTSSGKLSRSSAREAYHTGIPGADEPAPPERVASSCSAGA